MPEKTSQNIDQAPAAARGSLAIRTLWCELMHESPMRPMHGEYESASGAGAMRPWPEDRLISVGQAVGRRAGANRPSGRIHPSARSLQLIIALFVPAGLHVQAGGEPI